MKYGNIFSKNISFSGLMKHGAPEKLGRKFEKAGIPAIARKLHPCLSFPY